MERIRNVRHLGELVKKQQPEYCHKSDEEIGREALVQHPYYVQYMDVIDLDDRSLENAINTIDSGYSPDMGRLGAWWERGRTEARAKLRNAQTQELAATNNFLQTQTSLLRTQLDHAATPERKKREIEAERIIHGQLQRQEEFSILDHENTKVVMAEATGRKLPREAFATVRATEITNQLEVDQKDCATPRTALQ